ncbi:MAG: hypothetical protein MZV70_43615 [Desulfobacterales bacterium]|nr:hypothetical protein [Desulfobacterales bacterium]
MAAAAVSAVFVQPVPFRRRVRTGSVPRRNLFIHGRNVFHGQGQNAGNAQLASDMMTKDAAPNFQLMAERMKIMEKAMQASVTASARYCQSNQNHR